MSTGLDDLCRTLSANWDTDCNVMDGADMPILDMADTEILKLREQVWRLNNDLAKAREEIEDLKVEIDVLNNTGGAGL